MPKKEDRVCPGCGEVRSIRTDRTYCSHSCSARFRPVNSEQRLVIAGDVHFPNHDPIAIDLFLRFLAETRPHMVILNGDILDCYKISRWAQPGSPGPGMRAEIELAKNFITRIREILPEAEITYIEGNHDFRLRAFLNNEAAAVSDLDHNLTISHQLGLDALGVTYIHTPGEKWFSTHTRPFDDLLVGHFAKTSMHSAYAAKGLADRYGTSVVTGHNHSMGLHHRSMSGREVTAVEGGCLCDLNPPYMEPSNWRQGWVVAHKQPGEQVRLERVEVIDHAFYYGGKLYTA